MNEIIKFCDLNDNDNELIKRFEKLNLKRQDVYLIKADGKCYVCFKQKEIGPLVRLAKHFKTRIKKFILKLEKWFEKQNEIDLLIR